MNLYQIGTTHYVFHVLAEDFPQAIVQATARISEMDPDAFDGPEEVRTVNVIERDIKWPMPVPA